MPAWHLTGDTSHDKDALVSQSPVVVFNAATILQALGIISSRIILPTETPKARREEQDLLSKPTSTTLQLSMQTSCYMLRDKGASSLLSHERVLSVIVQASNKNSSHRSAPSRSQHPTHCQE